MLVVVKEPLGRTQVGISRGGGIPSDYRRVAHRIQLHDDMVFGVQIVWLVGIIRCRCDDERCIRVGVLPFHPVRVWVGSLSPAHKEVFVCVRGRAEIENTAPVPQGSLRGPEFDGNRRVGIRQQVRTQADVVRLVFNAAGKGGLAWVGGK